MFRSGASCKGLTTGLDSIFLTLFPPRSHRGNSPPAPFIFPQPVPQPSELAAPHAGSAPRTEGQQLPPNPSQCRCLRFGGQPPAAGLPAAPCPQSSFGRLLPAGSARWRLCAPFLPATTTLLCPARAAEREALQLVGTLPPQCTQQSKVPAAGRNRAHS